MESSSGRRGFNVCRIIPATRSRDLSDTFGNRELIRGGISSQNGSLSPGASGEEATAWPMAVLAASAESDSTNWSCSVFTYGLLTEPSFLGLSASASVSRCGLFFFFGELFEDSDLLAPNPCPFSFIFCKNEPRLLLRRTRAVVKAWLLCKVVTQSRARRIRAEQEDCVGEWESHLICSRVKIGGTPIQRTHNGSLFVTIWSSAWSVVGCGGLKQRSLRSYSRLLLLALVEKLEGWVHASSQCRLASHSF